MKLCRHNHEMTADNTGTAIHFNKWGKEYEQTYCKQCRRDSAQRYAATHKRRSRGKPKAKAEGRKKPVGDAVIRCPRSCKATARTQAGMDEHVRRIHQTLWP